jgi:hypothetical protein
MSKVQRVFVGLIGFVCGMVLTGALIFMLFWLMSSAFDRQMIPRGLGFILMPIFGGIFGYKAFDMWLADPSSRPHVILPIKYIAAHFQRGKVINRFCLVLAAIYVIAGHAILTKLEDMDLDRLYGRHLDEALTFIWFPVAIILLFPFFAAWAQKSKSDDEN